MKPNIWELNRTIITREQKRLETTSESTRDYFFTNMQITALERLDKNDSDHYPLLINLQITGKTMKSKWKIAYSKLELNEDTIHSILENKDWPTTTYPNRNKNTLFRKYTIRPTIKLQSEANKIFKQNIQWETKQIQLKDAWKESFKEYVANLDLKYKLDSSKFYKIINSLLRYKMRGTIVKGIEKEGKIMIENTMTQIIKEYFEQLYLGSEDKWEMKNNIFDYRLNIKRGIQYWALKKSTGIDGIPGEFYKMQSDKTNYSIDCRTTLLNIYKTTKFLITSWKQN